MVAAAASTRALAQPTDRVSPAPEPVDLSPSGRVVSVASGNGLRCVDRAFAGVSGGEDLARAVVEGVRLIEDDPSDTSVGLGGLPNAEGVVQLDASVMDGAMHKAGAVGAIEGIRNPAAVALKVLQRTDHVYLMGEGAKKFALMHGFKEENLLTEESRQAWVRWRENLGTRDDYMGDGDGDWDRDGTLKPPAEPGTRPNVPSGQSKAIPEDEFTYGTVHCAVVDAKGDIAATTSTSGLSWKIPGRVGDSPIIGAGMYVDNAAGAAGATGRGEAVIQSCGAFLAVEYMSRGMEPEMACLEVLRRIARNTRRRSLLNAAGEPNFNVTMYALRKDGLYGSACMRPGGTFAVHDGRESRVVRSTVLFGDND